MPQSPTYAHLSPKWLLLAVCPVAAVEAASWVDDGRPCGEASLRACPSVSSFKTRGRGSESLVLPPNRVAADSAERPESRYMVAAGPEGARIEQGGRPDVTRRRMTLFLCESVACSLSRCDWRGFRVSHEALHAVFFAFLCF